MFTSRGWQKRDGMAHYDVRGKDGQPAPYVVRR